MVRERVEDQVLEVRRSEKGEVTLVLRGRWSLDARIRLGDRWKRWLGPIGPGSRVRIQVEGLEKPDSLLAAFLFAVVRYCQEEGAEVDWSGVPEGIRRLVEMALRQPRIEEPPPRPSLSWIGRIGEGTLRGIATALDMMEFLGECTIGVGRWMTGRARTRLRDVLTFMQRSGVEALPIVLLINGLIGMILAFVGVVQLEQFGAAIYVADLVALAVLREMGALMTAIILSGRTGAAFAAQLGTMRVSEETDALQVLGISPMEFLVVPRLVAMTVMMPLLVVFADAIGLLGGAFVATTMLELSLRAYWHQTVLWVTLRHFDIGVIKGVVFGAIVAFWGCYYGMRSGRSAEAVGMAATRAVVASITSLIVVDAIFAVVLTVLDL